MHHYTREELEEMNCIELDQLANERGLLEDKDDDDDLDNDLLIGMILDDQNDTRVADEMEEDRQQHYRRLDEEQQAREGKDGSDDYC
ncbi:hypothetical protein pEaSNUABM28_00259 [Erwinia phage pEa_SNUABM_28]|nr:hypothetical protein pEaSNUABM28_00259 [Erwinia phage pEa_SNUABM_28]QZE59160.1 hypothetical protein pEaSNUABM18_00257 [Erwinia phage pEa_SNUABM_18]